MCKKIFFLFSLILTIITSCPTIFAESALTTVNVFGQIYYGTLTTDNYQNTVFSSVPDIASPFQITGKWKSDSFTGECTISYENGIIQTVTYKKNTISGKVQTYYTDGNYSLSNCSKGILRGKIEYFNSNNKLIGIDWYHNSTPIQSLVKQSSKIAYDTLIASPYDYCETPIKISGKISNIYFNSNGKICYIELVDSESNPYIFYYKNVNANSKYEAFSNMENLSAGDFVTIYGIFKRMRDCSEDPYTLYEYSLGYRTDFSELRSRLISQDILNRIKDLCAIESSALEGVFPVVHAIYCERNDVTRDNNIALDENYENICRYPFYFMDTKATISGTVLFDSFDADTKTITMLIGVDNTQEYYIIKQSIDTDEFSSLCGKHISLRGKRAGNEKIPYLHDSQTIGYALYPCIKASTVKLD